MTAELHQHPFARGGVNGMEMPLPSVEIGRAHV